MLFVKKLFAWIIDFSLFLSLFILVGINALVIVYLVEKDISVINVLLQTQLIPTLLVIYVAFILLFTIYTVLWTRILRATPGQRIMKLGYSGEKLNFFTIFLKNTIGAFWDIVLLPYALIALFTKKPMPSITLSGLTVSEIKQRYTKGHWITLCIALLFIGSAAAVGYKIYTVTPAYLFQKYTDYQKQTNALVKAMAFRDAAVSLEKYKEFHGEDSEYIYFHCIIEGNLSTSQESLPLCEQALESTTAPERKQAILLVKARIYAAHYNYTQAETLYAQLWNEFSLRTLDMRDYVVVLSELGKNKEAAVIIGEIATNIPSTDLIAKRDIAILYERVAAIDLALETYQKVLGDIPANEKLDLVGELNYRIGVILYQQGKKADSKQYFETAKELNKDFAEAADSYIILINKLAGSITR